jgi:hypothetical protein
MGIIDKQDLGSDRVSREKALVEVSQNPADLRIWLDNRKRGNLRYNVDIAKCVELKLKGLSVPDIAKIEGLNPENPRVIKWLRRYIDKFKPDIDLKDVAVYEGLRSHLLREKQQKMLSAIDDVRIAEAPLRDLVYAYDKLFDKERLNDNKSTGNVSMQFSSIVEGIHRRREDLDEPAAEGSDKAVES